MSDSGKLHIFFFPFLASGHMIQMVDMAKLFATRGVKSTLITTPASVPSFLRSIERTRMFGFDIDVITIRLPWKEVGLPEHVQNASNITSPDMSDKFFKAVMTMLDGPLERLMEEHRPDCLVADAFLPWTTAVAAKLGVPRVAFHVVGYFAVGAMECLSVYQPYKNVSSESKAKPFLLPNFPGNITLTRAQLPHIEDEKETNFTRAVNELRKSNIASYGVLVNSFYELEPVYADHYDKVVPGRRSWAVGPLLSMEIDEAGHDHECFKWLDSKEPDSIIYICFGSLASLNAHELHQIAVGLEASGQQFIWVVVKKKLDAEGADEWLPQGYEERMKGKGLILKGWAPQRSILQHKAVGSFVTHCGWSSVLEGIASGVTMVTWPRFGEHFHTEKLVTHVLGIGTPVGVEGWTQVDGNCGFDLVDSKKVEKAVKRVMVGEEAEEMKRKVRELSKMAKEAVQVGGSSHRNIESLLEELRGKKIRPTLLG